MSTTEHDLDAAPVDHVADEEFGGDHGSEPVDADADLEMGFDDVADIDVLGDDDLELDPDDVDVPLRAQDIDIAEDDDLELDDVEGRLGSFNAFLTEAQADHVDVADTDPSYQLPRVMTSTDLDVDDVEGLVDDREPVEPNEPDVSGDVLEELRRANIDGPTVKALPHEDAVAPHRQLKRSPEYDPAPMPIPLNLPRMLGRKPRVRRVTRVVRHVDPWSVFKIAIIANLLIYVIVLVAGVLLWNVAYATGTVDNVERFFESFGWSSFEFNGGEIYHSGWTGGLFLVIGFTGLAVLAATMFNLITDLVGGMRFTVLEEEVVETRSSPMRRFVVRRSEPEIPLVSTDESGQIVREAVVDESTRYIRPG
ncbi:MAG: DUF3566 domain-containing protein [Ilumatobacteraceae bacterium]